MKVKFHTLQLYLFYDSTPWYRKITIYLKLWFQISLLPWPSLPQQILYPCFLSFFPSLQPHFTDKPKHLATGHWFVSATQYQLLFDHFCKCYQPFQCKAYTDRSFAKTEMLDLCLFLLITFIWSHKLPRYAFPLHQIVNSR